MVGVRSQVLCYDIVLNVPRRMASREKILQLLRVSNVYFNLILSKDGARGGVFVNSLR
jgi:hypothetical protein